MERGVAEKTAAAKKSCRVTGPFAAGGAINGAMNRVSTTPAIRRRKVKAFRARGEIYNWLRSHAKDVGPLLERGEITWPALCAEMLRHGERPVVLQSTVAGMALYRRLGFHDVTRFRVFVSP